MNRLDFLKALCPAAVGGVMMTKGSLSGEGKGECKHEPTFGDEMDDTFVITIDGIRSPLRICKKCGAWYSINKPARKLEKSLGLMGGE